MAEITLTSAIRTNLLQLQRVDKLLGRTQERIATGKKVNTALDGPAAFFAAKSLTDRAGDLTSLKDNMGQAISTIKAADVAITSITSLVQQAKAIANTALQNLGSTEAAIASRLASASQYDELLTQIDQLVSDAGYAGKNLLLGDGAVYNATDASEVNVNALTGISGASVTDIGGGTSDSNVAVAITGTVDAQTSSVSTVQTAVGITSLTTTSFTSADDVTMTTTDDDTNNYFTSSNTYSTDYSNIVDTAQTQAVTHYLISENSGDSAVSDLGVTDLEVYNYTSTTSIDLSITSTSSTTTYAVVGIDSGLTSIGTAQTANDASASGSVEFYYADTTESAAIVTVLDTDTAGTAATYDVSSVADNVVDIEISVIGSNAGSTAANFTVNITYADGTTATQTTTGVNGSDQDITLTFTDGTVVNLYDVEGSGFDVGAATTASISLTQIKYNATGATAGANTGTSSLDIGSISFTASGTDSGDATVVIAASSTLSFTDTRDITITQGSTTYTRAVEPDTDEGTLSDGANTFVLSNGVSVALTVDLNVLAVGSSTFAAYTVTTAGTGNDLTVQFNETSTSNVSITSIDATTSGLSIAGAANDWGDSADITTAVTQLDAALDTLRDTGQSLSNNISIVQTREDFTTEFINTLEEGSDKWVLSDQNQEGANLLTLQTRQQLGIISLSIASQSAQSILRLFG